MVYVIVDSEKENHVLLVKAVTSDRLKQYLKITDTQKIVGSLTDNEVDVLHTSVFAVVSS